MRRLAGRLAVRFAWPWDYDLPGWLPLRVWVWSTAHGSDSYYWRILGVEINLETRA